MIKKKDANSRFPILSRISLNKQEMILNIKTKKFWKWMKMKYIL